MEPELNESEPSILKSIKLFPKQTIHVSSHQLEVIRNYRDLLHRWKFCFKISPRNSHDILLNGVPGLLGKVATSNDFLDFVTTLSCRTDDAIVAKPDFIKRILASHACRYAIMFGDVLSEKKCIKVISELSNCDLSFVCAHGRPTIVPLLDTCGLDDIQNKSAYLKRR